MFSKTDIVSNLLLAVVAYAAVKILLLVKNRERRPLPPGPKPWPVLGNITDLPKPGVREWDFWLEHKDKYGQSHYFDVVCPVDANLENDVQDQSVPSLPLAPRLLC